MVVAAVGWTRSCPFLTLPVASHSASRSAAVVARAMVVSAAAAAMAARAAAAAARAVSWLMGNPSWSPGVGAAKGTFFLPIGTIFLPITQPVTRQLDVFLFLSDPPRVRGVETAVASTLPTVRTAVASAAVGEVVPPRRPLERAREMARMVGPTSTGTVVSGLRIRSTIG